MDETLGRAIERTVLASRCLDGAADDLAAFVRRGCVLGAQPGSGAAARRRRGSRLREDIVALLAVAAERGVLVPDDLRERLSLGVRGLPATRMLRDELAAIVWPAP
jgi:hypothetical protein